MKQVLQALASVAFVATTVKARNLAGNAAVTPPPMADNSTYGNTEFISTRHVELDLVADFDSRTLNGTATHTMDVHMEVAHIQFDSWDLDISKVTVDGVEQTFSLVTIVPDIGSVLMVDLPRTYHTGEVATVEVEYTTSPTGMAFSWLTTE